MAVSLDTGDTRLIIRECSDYGCSNPQTAYILATANWETGGGMTPVKETVMPWHNDKNPTDKEVINRLNAWADKTGRSNRYWNDGWFGRGYVQLTHKENYQKAGISHNPDLALDPKTASRILVTGMMQGWFTGVSLTDYINGSIKDYMNARRVVNGADHSEEIAVIAKDYENELDNIKKPTGKKGILEWILSILGRILSHGGRG